jgi:hypothetical protein
MEQDIKASDIIQQELSKRGLATLKEAARFLGISTELLRVTLHAGHLPKDRTLDRIAQRLGLEASMLILAAHQERIPSEVKHLFLAPLALPVEKRERKRKWPLSQEQCEYLSQIMTAEEIQLVRKCRQLTDDERKQVLGYLHFQFATARNLAAERERSEQPTDPVLEERSA